MRRVAAALGLGLLGLTIASAQDTIYRPGQIFTINPSAPPGTCTVGSVYIRTMSNPTISVCGPVDTWVNLAPVTIVPTGAILLIASGTCPTGYTENTALNGRTLVGTLAANGNIGTTGGADSVAPDGSINTHPSTVTTLPIGPTSTLTGLGNHTFTGTRFDNRSAFTRVIFCTKT